MKHRRKRSLSLSRHARGRMRQRGISADAVALAVEAGRRIRQADGRVVYFVGERELRSIPPRLVPPDLPRLAVVVHCRRCKVLTVMHVDDPSWIRSYTP